MTPAAVPRIRRLAGEVQIGEGGPRHALLHAPVGPLADRLRYRSDRRRAIAILEGELAGLG